MPNTASNGHLHPRLIRCTVHGDQDTVRYVDLAQFRLWEYMMQHRHNLAVSGHALCLWLGEETFMRNAGPFSHAGDLVDVDRIRITVFDPDHHYLFDIQRYVPTEDSDTVSDILLSHLPANLTRQQDYDLDITHGYCVERRLDPKALDLVLGLAGHGTREPEMRVG